MCGRPADDTACRWFFSGAISRPLFPRELENTHWVETPVCAQVSSSAATASVGAQAKPSQKIIVVRNEKVIAR